MKNAMVSNLKRALDPFLSRLSADCSDPNCSGHGACVSGKCYCKAGWQGERCNQVDQQVYQCLPGCSDHGTYDLESAACVCEEHWTGVDCSQPSCGLDCGLHGSCEQGRCKSVYTHMIHTRTSSFMYCCPLWGPSVGVLRPGFRNWVTRWRRPTAALSEIERGK